MAGKYKVISVTPAGRKDFLEVLVPYLLKNRDIISEHHFWLNTTNKRDIKYMESLAEEYPDFFKIIRRDVFDPVKWRCIWQYFQDYVDENTIYIRLDDDICFIADGAISKLINCRIDNPKPFIIFGNMINNATCSYWHQQINAIPKEGYQIKPGRDTAIVDSGEFAEKVHSKFLADYKKGEMSSWRLQNITGVRPSVNAICWFGKDLKKVEELKIKDLRDTYITIKGEKYHANYEEWMLNRLLAKKYNRPNMICGDAVFVHFSYTNQNEYLLTKTNLLDEYKNISRNKIKKIYFPLLRRRRRHWERNREKYLSYIHIYAKKIFPAIYGFLGYIKNKIKAIK